MAKQSLFAKLFGGAAVPTQLSQPVQQQQASAIPLRARNAKDEIGLEVNGPDADVVRPIKKFEPKYVNFDDRNLFPYDRSKLEM